MCLFSNDIRRKEVFLISNFYLKLKNNSVLSGLYIPLIDAVQTKPFYFNIGANSINFSCATVISTSGESKYCNNKSTNWLPIPCP